MNAKSGLTCLARLTLRDPGQVPKLQKALELGLPDSLECALEVSRESGHPVVQALGAIAAARGDATLDDRLWEHSRGQSNALAPLRAEVGLRKLRRAVEAGASAEDLHHLRSECASVLRFLGRTTEALPIAEADVAALREAGAEDVQLATSLQRLAALCRSEGQGDRAIALALETIEVVRRSVTDDEGLRRILLWSCFIDLAQWYADVGDPDAETFETSALEEARALAFSSPSHRSRPATTLLVRAHRIGRTRPQDAVEMIREGLEIYEELYEEQPDGWGHRLAATLRDTARYLFAAGLRARATEQLDRAERLFRNLALSSDDQNGDDLAMTLCQKAALIQDEPAQAQQRIQLLVEALQLLVSSGRSTWLSGHACLLLVAATKDADPVRASVFARMGVFQILNYANAVDHPDRVELLLCLPMLADQADPTGVSGLRVAITDLVGLLGVTVTGGAVREELDSETLRSGRGNELLRSRAAAARIVVRRCLEGLAAACARAGDTAVALGASKVARSGRGILAGRGGGRSPGGEGSAHDDANALLGLAATAHARGALDDALESCDAILELPVPVEATGLVWFNKANIFMQQGKVSEAEEAYVRASNAPPPQQVIPHVFNNLIELLTRASRLHEALVCAEEAVARTPDAAMLWAQKARALYYLDRHFEAQQAARTALQLEQEDSLAWKIEASTRASISDMVTMLEQSKATIRAAPDEVVGWSGLIVASLNLGLVTNALTAIQEALARNPAWHDIRALRAAAWIARRAWADAIRETDLVLEAAPQNRRATFFKQAATAAQAYEQKLAGGATTSVTTSATTPVPTPQAPEGLS
jgi:tetratricopeptide (TPR) repeat protein